MEELSYFGGLRFQGYNLKREIKRCNDFAAKADDIINSIITENMSDLEKEMAIHDYIVKNTAYDYENYINGTIPQKGYHADGVLLDGIGVCQGYAEAIQLLLTKAGIKSMVIDGGGELNHAWNIVEIDGKNYHVDATWNDSIPDSPYKIKHRYFNLSDKAIGRDHKWPKNVFPKCNDKRFDYLYDNRGSIYEGEFYFKNKKDNWKLCKINMSDQTEMQSRIYKMKKDGSNIATIAKGNFIPQEI